VPPPREVTASRRPPRRGGGGSGRSRLDLAPSPRWRRLGAEVRRAIEVICELAEPCPVHLVGGCVRDLLLGLDTVDVDVVVEGDAVALARRAGPRLGAVVTAHPRFGTARLRLSNRTVIDLATARAERYPAPAVLPEVEPAPLMTDLARRDFTINAMAVRVGTRRFGPLMDPFGGREDLRRRVIRVLHDQSFIDDPTRIFRAVRLAARFGFRIEHRTDGLLRAAVRSGVVTKLAGPRVRAELARAAREASAPRIFRRLGALGVLVAVHPALHDARAATGLLERARRALVRLRRLSPPCQPDAAQTYLLGLLHPLRSAAARSVIERLGVSPRDAGKLDSDLGACRRAARRVRGTAPLRRSRIASLIDPLSPEARALLLAVIEDTGARDAVLGYLRRSPALRPALTGADLQRLGVPPGPIYGEIFAALRTARLDGRLRSAEEEIAYVRRRFMGRLLPA
jgi:tRNA nucleotidyltransferase (CCA-adding enzyme)